MPPTAPADATLVLQQLRAQFELGVQRWQQRLPRGHLLGHPADILESISGALWLELVSSPSHKPLSCLRRVLYYEFERPWRHSASSLDLELLPWLTQACLESGVQGLDLPPHLLPWAEEYLHHGGPQGRLDWGTSICGSRRQMRLRNSALLTALQDGQFLSDLKKRAARLCTAVAMDGATPAHRRTARDLQCIIKMLEATPELLTIRQAISNIAAAQKPASRVENVESASV